MRNKHLVWTDLETTGLDDNVANEAILEVGFKITDLDLNVVAENSWLVWGGWQLKCWDRSIPFVREMHDGSGLIRACRQQGHATQHVEGAAFHWLSEQYSKFSIVRTQTPMCGNSIQLDRVFLREHMPLLFGMFHYRNLDVSSLKESFAHHKPEVAEKLETVWKHKDKPHRALDDLDNSIAEYSLYLEEMGLR